MAHEAQAGEYTSEESGRFGVKIEFLVHIVPLSYASQKANLVAPMSMAETMILA